jgi:type IV/VI secretion system ImpK/VasF family protein
VTLLELCEPLFQYICRLNRSVRAGAMLEPATIRAEIKSLLDGMRAKSAADAALRTQFEKIELVLIFFVDYMVKESRSNVGQDWQEIAYERNELAGDEKFFDLLDETLADPGPAASERLAVFYNCMGLGFTGWYTGQPEYLRKKMDECRARIGDQLESPEVSRVCPEAYEHVDTSDLIEPPGRSLVGITIALVGLIVVLVVANIYVYQNGRRELENVLQRIIDLETDNGAAAPSAARPARDQEAGA